MLLWALDSPFLVLGGSFSLGLIQLGDRDVSDSAGTGEG
jgi:hypothetical protein